MANASAPLRLHRSGFSLLEVMIALGLLSIFLFVLVQAQGTAVMMTREAEDMTTATYLAKEKMAQVVLMVESEGFQESDIEEEGNFENGLFSGFEMGGLDDQYNSVNSDAFEGYQWAYTVREVNLQLGDMSGMADTFGGMQDEQTQERMQQSDQQPDLNDAGISNDMIADFLNPYIREVRVVVWWGENEDETDQVDLTTHIVNPSGQVVPSAGGAGGAGG